MGIGGAYLCIYGMEGPGGYQFVGEPADVESLSHGRGFRRQALAAAFLRSNSFLSVSAGELQTIRRDFPLGRYPLRIEHTTLKLAEYQQFLADEAPEIEAFRAHQQAAFNAERERWIAGGQAHLTAATKRRMTVTTRRLRSGESGVESPVAGNLCR